VGNCPGERIAQIERWAGVGSTRREAVIRDERDEAVRGEVCPEVTIHEVGRCGAGALTVNKAAVDVEEDGMFLACVRWVVDVELGVRVLLRVLTHEA
jgi:hypothetical protein